MKIKRGIIRSQWSLGALTAKCMRSINPGEQEICVPNLFCQVATLTTILLTSLQHANHQFGETPIRKYSWAIKIYMPIQWLPAETTCNSMVQVPFYQFLEPPNGLIDATMGEQEQTRNIWEYKDAA